jgi:hypothetical protein
MTLALASAPLFAAATDPRLEMLEAMRVEAARSMERLRIGGYEPPYYLAYQVKEIRSEELAGRFGSGKIVIFPMASSTPASTTATPP